MCLMDEPPKDWQHNPKRPYLVFEGKFVQFPPREPDLRDEIMAIVQPKKSKNLPNSILGKRKAMLGDRIGTDNRKRLEIRWEGTTMLGDIDSEYSTLI